MGDPLTRFRTGHGVLAFTDGSFEFMPRFGGANQPPRAPDGLVHMGTLRAYAQRVTGDGSCVEDWRFCGVIDDDQNFEKIELDEGSTELVHAEFNRRLKSALAMLASAVEKSNETEEGE